MVQDYRKSNTTVKQCNKSIIEYELQEIKATKEQINARAYGLQDGIKRGIKARRRLDQSRLGTGKG